MKVWLKIKTHFSCCIPLVKAIHKVSFDSRPDKQTLLFNGRTIKVLWPFLLSATVFFTVNSLLSEIEHIKQIYLFTRWIISKCQIFPPWKKIKKLTLLLSSVLYHLINHNALNLLAPHCCWCSKYPSGIDNILNEKELMTFLCIHYYLIFTLKFMYIQRTRARVWFIFLTLVTS